MDNNLVKRLNEMLYKIPKKELAQNLAKAKSILNSSNKEDLNKLLNSKPVSDLLGKDKEKLQNAIDNNEVKTKDIEEIENFLNNKE